MSLKGLLSSRGSAASRPPRAEVVSALSDGERLAMLDELEKSGLGWFWSSDAEGRLTGSPLSSIGTRHVVYDNDEDAGEDAYAA